MGLHRPPSGPAVVTLALKFAQAGVGGARELLAKCLVDSDIQVRLAGAVALSAFDRPAAIRQLATELSNSERAYRDRASDYLLMLGDARGIPSLIERLDDPFESIARFACHDLRIYTQQPRPCDPSLPADQRARNSSGWREWWRTNAQTFRVMSKEAELDGAAWPSVAPVSFRPAETID